MPRTMPRTILMSRLLTKQQTILTKLTKVMTKRKRETLLKN